MDYIKEIREMIGTQPLITVGACVIVFNDKGHLLMQKRSDSLDWGTIGGMMEPGETLEETAARELYEEAGLEAESFRFKTIVSGEDMHYIYLHGDEIYHVAAVYEAEGVTGRPTVNDDEGLELKFFSLAEPIPNLNPLNEAILKKAHYL
ncbi:MAG TPA: NUDIX domain-containing protein [Bacillales bacterium]|nr:NUDIX domain-containing protein [Bacillales bacterium]